MVLSKPAEAFEAVAQFDTGLTGTLAVRIIDNAGATATSTSSWTARTAA